MSFKRLPLRFFFEVLFSISGAAAYGQVGGGGTTTDGREGTRIINTGVPFLLIAPDARSGAMGDVGVALSADANSVHWNPSKLAFMENKNGVSLSYSPWLQKLVPDISLSYFSAYHRLDDRNTVGMSLRFFSLGQIQLIDVNRNDLGTYSPSELALDGTFARKFGENFSLGTAFRFIYSNLSNGQFSSGQDTKAGTALAADISGYYRKGTVLFGKDARISTGLNISNIGNKISYVENGNKVFLPTNFKLGGAATIYPDAMNELTFALDLNKLLVPSPPVYGLDANNQVYIVQGRDPSSLSVPAAIFSSFGDAPGGLKEELQEISYSAGLEYWYNKQFAVRSGYFYENPDKGDRQYLTLGAGLRYNVFNLDFAYTVASQKNSPLANTLRFSLVFNFKTKQEGR
ncbi:type IX secretion system outer membrane channel protein PorV [Hufsiella ginkgonis]|uniref:Type IX secretion system outer membrane channel protein PorV n=1 Tax=Hufsiella ginkgonis TaxID=2695274 RepID=A0A7K1Y477_9SPHI|nr:type IX secretion system outer membrane channel protein PorV [Hufsiella ginkgonis]MXV17506.1 type IX secretion system outer membrane channel protein PorV [Hufsiella ginkgonis]